MEKTCKLCGHKLSDFRKTMMLGCPYCYEQFYSEISQVLMKVQGKTTHVGKNPEINTEQINALKQQKEYLLALCQQYNLQGNFSKVKSLNIQIENIQQQINQLQQV